MVSTRGQNSRVPRILSPGTLDGLAYAMGFLRGLPARSAERIWCCVRPPLTAHSDSRMSTFPLCRPTSYTPIMAHARTILAPGCTRSGPPAHTPAEVLFADKEKLNFKPPGGAGFAPHLDAPSLRVGAVGAARTFMTLMVAIDPMTAKNGCLRVVRGSWSEQKHCEVIHPEDGSDPDSGGRAGAIPAAVADTLDFEDVICASGDVVAFNGWVPHRSGVNASPFERRAVFLTCNPLSQGNMHEAYYDKMADLRSAWRAGEVARLADFAAFATVPK